MSPFAPGRTVSAVRRKKHLHEPCQKKRDIPLSNAKCPRNYLTSPLFPPNRVSCLHLQQVSWLGFILRPVFPE